MPPSLMCRFCDKLFERNFCLKRHVKNVHKVTTKKSIKGNFCCPLCNVCVNLHAHFVKHCIDVHDITVKSETFNFETEQEFELWKKETEKSSNTYFVRKTSDWKTKPENPVRKTSQLHCSRSGFFKPKPANDNRKREVKIQGSRKINGYNSCY